MPAGQPFTALCKQLARPDQSGRADLHLHTTCSDGTYTPAQIVELARRCALTAIAITDHDTLAGYAPARDAAGSHLEVIPGVEITCTYQGQELHLLAYFIDPEDRALTAALDGMRVDRRHRFAEMVECLARVGVRVDVETSSIPDAPGRRSLAELLVQQGKVGSVREAFHRWLADGGVAAVPKRLLPVAEAIHLVHQAGGVAAWAHPIYDGTMDRLTELARLGLGAVEAEYPDVRRSVTREWRAWARGLGLAISGGSDCHGPGRRSVGSCTISAEDLAQLRHGRSG